MRPLAERMRPQSLTDYLGQKHLVGPNGPLQRAIESGNIPSFILWGQPGIGKTTLARIVAQSISSPFYSLSAISAGVKEVREVIEKAKNQKFFDRKSPILFIDEIHRFSKAQQDALLGAVEDGTVVLIGATTENPSFEVIPALLSRCQVYILNPLDKEDLMLLVEQALQKDEFLKDKKLIVKEYEALLRFSGGDARKLYNILELIANHQQGDTPLEITNDLTTQWIQQNLAIYDKGGEFHYDIASALIKSIRGSDPNAALYWLARMIDAGEDVKFIARRILISAAEDIGLANPNALLMANTAFQAVQVIGMPEARIILSEAVIYLTTAPKSNSAYLAIDEALDKVRKTGTLPVPLHLRNAPTGLMKNLGYGKAYLYPHDYPEHFENQEYLPDQISGTRFFNPGENQAESKISQFLARLWKGKYHY
jgi:putative ATPase